MIIWINGAFGSGKTSVAEAIKNKINNSFIYDPEQVGYFLWHVFPDDMKRKCNFQHIAIWRELNYKILKHISDSYNGIIIAPMTIYIKQYYDEIIGSLVKDDVTVKHFILSATKQTIINRLIQRGNPDNENDWARQHIDKCINAFETDILEEKIFTDDKNADDVAIEIIKLSKLTQ